MHTVMIGASDSCGGYTVAVLWIESGKICLAALHIITDTCHKEDQLLLLLRLFVCMSDFEKNQALFFTWTSVPEILIRNG